MKSKRQNYDSVQSLIIATAARLFTERGADGASLNDIAKAADIAKGTLYYYYPARMGLLRIRRVPTATGWAIRCLPGRKRCSAIRMRTRP